jgi:dTDP-4-amino-4,6-dideoxygalactose transaminase
MSQVGKLLELLCRPALAGGTELVGQYEQAFAQAILGDPSIPCLAFWKGRVALWTILRALGGDETSEVVIPAFTCEMVPAAVKFAGFKCVYADVAPEEYNAAAAEIAGLIGPRTTAAVCQHTYGVFQDAAATRALAATSSATVIEDCCQLVTFPTGPGAPARTGAAAFFSTQWNKPFSTGLGGMAAFNDQQLYEAAKDLRSTFNRTGDRSRARCLALQVVLYQLTVRPSTQAMVADLYRFAQRRGWVRGTNAVEEYGRTMPEDYPSGATDLQAILGLRQLKRWAGNVRHRRLLTEFYLQRLPRLDADAGALKVAPNQALWAVPLLVENKQEILSLASRSGLPIATWFDVLPVHLAPATAERYDYHPGQCPRAEQMVAREIHLPTSPAVTLEQAEAALRLLRRRARLTSL